MTGDDALAELLGRLRVRSGFSEEAMPADRLRAWLRGRAAERGVDEARAIAHALAVPEEFARIEAHFAPPETWLFRYPESFELVRSFASARRGGTVRALILGAGGWCEPISMACAVLDGGALPAIEAVDRNAAAMALPDGFAGVQIRGAFPPWAERHFTRAETGVRPHAALVAAVRARVGDIGAVAGEHALRGERFDLIAFRNTAIYLGAEMRGRIHRLIAELCAPDGLVLVGHAEVTGAAAALGFQPVAAQGAFALKRSVAPAAASAAPTVPGVARTSVPPPPASAAAPTPDSARDAAARAPEPLDPLAQLRADAAARPADPAAHVALARALEQSGDKASAAEAVQRALYLDRFHEEALLLAAQLAEARGARADAERLRQRALRVHLDRMRRDEQG